MCTRASSTLPTRILYLKCSSYVLRLTQDQTASANDTEALRAQLAEAQSDRTALQQRCAAAEARIRELGQRDADAAADAAAQAAEARAAAERRMAEREASLQREVSALQGHLRELRTSHEQVTTQLLHASQPGEGGGSEQIDTLVADLQKANERAAQAERRTSALRTESEQARAEEAAVYRKHLAQLQERTQALEQAQALARESSEQLHAEAQRRAEAERQAQQQRADAAEQESAALRHALGQRHDYDEIKRELDVLKAVEFAGEEDDAAPAEEEGATRPLEAHLVRRNRKLQDELATLRAALADQKRDVAAVEAERDAQRTQLQELQTLTKRLESDLLNAAPKEEAAPAASGLLPIVTSQRDRFRTRNAELEQELRTQLESMNELRGEIKRLQADNLSMYEKVRYLQNFGGKAAAPTDMPYPMQPRGMDAEDPYRARYEQSIHPFEAFRGREQSRALASLSPIDRLLHLLTSAVLGNAQMRLVFVCYAVILHILVFGMLLDAGHRAVEPQ